MQKVAIDRLAAAILLALALGPGGGAAQEAGLRLTPFIGAYRPLGHAGFMSVSTMPLAGVRLESGGSLRLRAGAAVTAMTTARQNVFCLAVAPGPCPPLEANLRMELGSAGLALDLTRRGAVRPYVLAEAGVKHYSFGEEAADAFGGARTDIALDFGAGVQARLGGLDLVAEASDMLSHFRQTDWSDRLTQHDLALTLGVRLGL